jgi:hypothetical protein
MIDLSLDSTKLNEIVNRNDEENQETEKHEQENSGSGVFHCLVILELNAAIILVCGEFVMHSRTTILEGHIGWFISHP